MSGPFGEISLVPRFNLEVESIRPVQDLILGFYLVISVAFHLETLAVYQVAASLLLLEWQVKKFSRNTLHASSSSAISALRVGIRVHRFVFRWNPAVGRKRNSVPEFR